MKLTYLDNGATTFPKPEKVYQAMDDVNRNLAMTRLVQQTITSKSWVQTVAKTARLPLPENKLMARIFGQTNEESYFVAGHLQNQSYLQ